MKTRLRFMSTALGMIALFSALGPPLSAQSFTTKTFSVGGKVPTCAVADINCDGRPDLISANLTTNTLTVLTNNGAGAFGRFATLTVGNHPDWVIAADVNGDGAINIIDLATVGQAVPTGSVCK